MRAVEPLARFAELYARASREAPCDPSAMALATADAEGRPSVRMVLLRGVDALGFRFYTNYDSRKGLELEARPEAALCIYWPWIDEQVRAEGPVEKLPPEESDRYFATRARGSQLGAWASAQSRPVAHRYALLRKVAATELRFLGREVERPPHWGGYLLRPRRVEFWTAKPSRLHERLLYEREAGAWRGVRLQP
jgi:pyridoxamine 5'-phosphate oxidase